MEEPISKATHEMIHLWQPVIKNKDGNYIAVLSDDSLDRDDEFVGKSALQDIMNYDGYTAILLNHKNDVLMQIGHWTNKRLEEAGGYTAFVAEPKFYMSNPNAQIIKGCMDEGAVYGVSIGAIPKSWDMVEKNGMIYKRYTKLELLEASFVAIPSNRHGRALAVAKMFGTDKPQEEQPQDKTNKDIKQEETKMADNATQEPIEKTFTQKEFDTEMTKLKELNDDVSKKLELSNIELAKAKDDLAKLNSDKELIVKEFEELKKMSVMKGDMTTVENGDNSDNNDLQKAISEGQLPIVNKN